MQLHTQNNYVLIDLHLFPVAVFNGWIVSARKNEQTKEFARVVMGHVSSKQTYSSRKWL